MQAINHSGFCGLAGYRKKEPLLLNQRAFPVRSLVSTSRALAAHGHRLTKQAKILSKSDSKAVEVEIDQDEAPSTSYTNIIESRKPVEDRLRSFAGTFIKTATVGALCLALAFASAGPALAARSGGHMGGSNFGRSKVASSHSSRSYGGSKFGGSVLSPTLRGSVYDLGGRHARSTPSLRYNSFGWFGPPVIGGYGYGYPVATGGGGFGNIILLGVLAAVLWTAFTSFSDAGDGSDFVDERVTVAKLQVGLLGSARQLQRDLERIARKANTDTPSGLHYILQETVLALLRNPDYCVYGACSTSNKRGLDAGESKFNELSMEERSKFKEETLVNVGGRTKSSSISRSSGGGQHINELIVVTILVAVEGGVKLPNVTSLEELRAALNRLGGIGSEQTLAVEVLWTPQEEGDYFTKDEIFQDYPTLNNL